MRLKNETDKELTTILLLRPQSPWPAYLPLDLSESFYVCFVYNVPGFCCAWTRRSASACSSQKQKSCRPKSSVHGTAPLSHISELDIMDSSAVEMWFSFCLIGDATQEYFSVHPQHLLGKPGQWQSLFQGGWWGRVRKIEKSSFFFFLFSRRYSNLDT